MAAQLLIYVLSEYNRQYREELHKSKGIHSVCATSWNSNLHETTRPHKSLPIIKRLKHSRLPLWGIS